MDNGFWEGAERASGTILNTGMNLMKFKQDQMIQNEQLNMQKARFNYAMQKEAEAQADYDKPVDITVHPMFLSLPDEVKPQVLKFFQDNGWINELGRGKKGDILQGVDTMEKTTPLFKQFFEPVVNAKKAKVLEAWNQLQEVTASGDPKKIQIAQKQFQDLSTDYISSSSQFDKHLENLMKADKETQPSAVKEYNFAVSQGYKGTFEEWETKQKKAGATTVNISNKVGEEGLTKLSGEMGKQLVDERKDVEGAVKALNNIKEAEQLVNSGIITGTGAEYLTNFGNFASSRLGIDTGRGAVANTQAYAATMGNQVGQIIKQFGSGTGLSDADREYAEKIVGGKITLNEQAIRKLLAINKRAHENVIRNFNKKAEQVMKKKGSDQLPYDLRVDYDFGEIKPKKIGRFTVMEE